MVLQGAWPSSSNSPALCHRPQLPPSGTSSLGWLLTHFLLSIFTPASGILHGRGHGSCCPSGLLLCDGPAGKDRVTLHQSRGPELVSRPLKAPVTLLTAAQGPEHSSGHALHPSPPLTLVTPRGIGPITPIFQIRKQWLRS